jgi:asparagine synthase (glutamine-hydrolysing)
VVLTGEGSDEMLGGYLHFARDVASRNGNGKHGAALLAASQARISTASAPANGNGRSLTAVRRLLGFVPGWIQTSAAQSTQIHAVLADHVRESFRDVEGFRSFFNDLDVPGQLAGREPLHQSLYLWAKTRLPNYLLTILGDRMEMAHSVEGRVPFLDHHLVKVVRCQPVTQKIRGPIQKYVLREAVRDLVTDAVYRRPKHVFQTPPTTLNPKGRLSVLVQDTLRGPQLASLPFCDRKKVLGLLDASYGTDEQSRVATDQVLMILSSACILNDRFHLSA